MSKVQQIAALLPQEFDAALIVGETNRRYLTGFSSSAGYVLVTRDAAYFLTDFRYIEAAQRRVRDMECHMYAKASESLHELIKKHQLRRIAVEDEGLSCAGLRRLQAMLEGVELCGGALDPLITGLRMIKTPDELAKIREAQALTDDGFSYILPRIAAGRTEKDIALELEFYIRRQGAEAVSFDFIVVSGVNSSLPHGEPSDKVVEPGDFLTMDFGALVDGWHSDMTRTVAVQRCSDEQRAVYDIVLQAQLASLSVLREGLPCVAGDAAARDLIAAAGYGDCFGHGTGHCVGVEIHEEPRLSVSAGDAVLKSGMVITVEPGIYLPGRFGVRIEDMAAITSTGCENLTHSTKELLIVG